MMWSVMRAAGGLMLVMTMMTGVAYPLTVTGVAQAVFPWQAGGSLLERDGVPVGSALIGQAFSQPGYFHGRPSLAGTGYDAASSGASNLAPSSAALMAAIDQRAAALRQENPEAPHDVPVDLVTASASGLDPHISPAAALWQVNRVARARGVSPEAVRALVMAHVEGRALGFLGEPVVNVLRLNQALDQMQPR